MAHSNRSAGPAEPIVPRSGDDWEVFLPGEAQDWQGTWDALNSRSTRSPVLDSRFVGALLDHFGTGQERIAFLHRGNKLAAATVLSPEKRGLMWRTFQPSQAPVGLWLQENNLDLGAALPGLCRVLPGPSPLLAVSQLDPDLVVRPQDSNRLATLDYIETARISLNGTFDDYWGGRGKNLRHNMKRQRNRLEREGVQIGFQGLSRPQEMERGVEDYGRLESAGWKSARGTAIELNNQQGRFYQDLLERFAATGQARCYRLYFDDRLVASDLCVSGFGTLVILKTTHDEECKGYSPGQLLHREEVPQCFAEAGLSSLEFYGKVMDWHRRWTSDVRQMYHVNFYTKPVWSVAHKFLSKLSQRQA